MMRELFGRRTDGGKIHEWKSFTIERLGTVTEKVYKAQNVSRRENCASLSADVDGVSDVMCPLAPVFFHFLSSSVFRVKKTKKKKEGGGGKERKREKKISPSLRGVVKNLFITKLMPELPKSHCATDAR
jgi:hypothetical protein